MKDIMKQLSIIKKLPKLPLQYRKQLKLTQLDKDIFSLSKSSFLNYAMTPIIGAVDTYWISKLNHGSMLAGQGTGDRLFNSIFSMISFTPAVITPLISRYHAFNDKENMVNTISTSIFLVSGYGSLITLFLFFKTKYLVKTIIPEISPSYLYACHYFQLRCLGLIFALLNSLAFAILRGQKDLKTPMRFNVYSQLCNAILDPIFMQFMGVRGVALGTLISEIFGFILFYSKLYKDKIINFGLIKYNQIFKIVTQGLSVQLRGVSLNLVFLLASRKIQHIDYTDKLAATHVLNLQLFEFGFILSYSYGLISSILIPRYKDPSFVIKRLHKWGFLVSTIVATIHLFGFKILRFFTSDTQILMHSNMLIPIGALFQAVNTFTCINEGTSQGLGMYKVLGSGAALALAFFSLIINKTSNLQEIWVGFIMCALIRIYVNIHFIGSKLKNIKSRND